MASGGIDAVLGRSEQRPMVVAWWVMVVLRWLQNHTPREFGFLRWRWTCESLAWLLWDLHRVRISGETIRRALHQHGFVWRRPRPVVGPKDPEYSAKLRAIRRMLKGLGSSETAVFQDEVDVHLNPKIGSQWMEKGKQAEVLTPGNNEKRHLSGALDWRTGRLYVSPPHFRRNGQLFVEHLQELCRRLRCYRVIHVICDNASFHSSRLVREFLAQQQGRIQLHFLPKYAPETNPIERVWWHLHENVTRNHRCRDMTELLGDVYDYLEKNNHHYFELHRVFDQAA
jgi:transposase